MRLYKNTLNGFTKWQDDSEYITHDIDEAADPKYYGALHYSGAWIITKFTGGIELRYAIGRENYTTAWTGRAGLTYDYINNIID
jgi:hypothetical protein